VAAVGPHWRPAPGEPDVPTAAGRLALHEAALVFRADELVDRRSGEPIVDVIPAEAVTGAGPLSPGSPITASRQAGEWMPAWQRRFRSPGFVITTAHGPWAFDCPRGVRRAAEVRRRYVEPNRARMTATASGRSSISR
jgi:hypothetical protein